MPLVVYKSSAGSGKTTTLVTEYLKISLTNPNSFRNILAITFTNKAANQMKERIIETLQELSDESKKPSPKLNDLVTFLNFDRKKLSRQAQILLKLILHNYDEFAISTIDSFIHRIIRTFATDVDLPQNFEVVIDSNDIIPDIIQNLYNKVGKDAELTKVLVNFVLSQADEENSYDPTFQLTGFVKRQMNEDGFTSIEKLKGLTLKELNSIIERLQRHINIEKSSIINIAKQSIELCYNNNLEIDDFYYGKSGLLAYFIKLKDFAVADDKLFPGKVVVKTIEEGSWYAAKTSNAAKYAIDLISDQLTENYYNIISSLEKYFYYRLIFSKIYSLALVHEISKLFAEFTEQTYKVHISEFNKKISKEIADQPVPFIYERLGRKYRYFLIDEFQDTSVLQWYNLLPLIEESLSYGNFNMLVGDAKQAIYRFRSGEVELFSNLPNLYKNDGSQLMKSRQALLRREFNEVVLSANYRSQPEIINFNNSFFKIITDGLSERTKSIYSNLKQQVPSNKNAGGFVSLNFIDDDDPEVYLEEKLLKIQEFIDDLKENNYLEKDICILCRVTKNASKIAGFLLDNNYNVVSSESLKLTNSPKVRLIISFFKLLVFPENEMALAELIDNYLRITGNKDKFDTDFKLIKKSRITWVDAFFKHYNLVYFSKNLRLLSNYEIAEFLIKNVIKQNEADIFLQYLLDFIFENNLSTSNFLLKWEDKKNNLFITMPEDINAIKIMTIHKAKGLDFKAVIVDASMLKNNNTKTEYWRDIELEEFSELKVGLFPLSKKIELIGELSVYEEETDKTELDFINVLYVANTRPVNALFTISQIKTRRPYDLLATYQINYLKAIGSWQEDNLNYNFGNLTPIEHTDDELVSHEGGLDTFVSTDWNKLINIAIDDDLVDQSIDAISSGSYGKLIHSILSQIKTTDELPHVINRLKNSGLIIAEDFCKIEETVKSVIFHQELNKYYKPNLIIKNETELLDDNGKIIRPDRVVIDGTELVIIDYKTGAKKPADNLQIEKYKQAFINMGYNSIVTKLVYVGSGVEVVM